MDAGPVPPLTLSEISAATPVQAHCASFGFVARLASTEFCVYSVVQIRSWIINHSFTLDGQACRQPGCTGMYKHNKTKTELHCRQKPCIDPCQHLAPGGPLRPFFTETHDLRGRFMTMYGMCNKWRLAAIRQELQVSPNNKKRTHAEVE